MSEETIFAITPPISPRISGDEVPNGEDLNADDIPCKQALIFRWFSCLGEAKIEKIILSNDGYVKNHEITLFEDFEIYSCQCNEKKTIDLFNETFDLGSVFLYNIETLFRMLRSEIIVLQDAAKANHTDFHTFSDFQTTQDYRRSRRHCIKFFLTMREYFNCLTFPKYSWVLNSILSKLEENLNGFRFFLRRITHLPAYVQHHAAHTQGNKCLEPSYHLFHCNLDMFWLHISTVYLVDKCRRRMEECISESQQSDNNLTLNKVTLEHSVLALIADLVQLAVIRFEKVDVQSISIKSPFNCSCVAELWIMIQLFTNRMHSKGIFDKNFWTFVNKVMEELFMTAGQNSVKSSCSRLVQSVTHPCSNVHAFAIWFLKHTAMLYTYEEKSCCSNYPLLELIVKGLLNSDVSESHLRIYLTFIEKIVIKYWEPKSDIIILLWEYFQKRLNLTFYVPGSSVDSLAIMCESVAGLVKQVKARLSGMNSNDDSFQMFLRILGLHLQRVSGQGQHWNQIRGRIYSKLSPSKIQGLTEVGLYHLSSLFLTLAVTADLGEVCKKLQLLLGSLKESEIEVSTHRLVWRTHLSLCLLSAERGQDFTSILSPMTDALCNFGSSQQDLSLFRTFIDGLRDILECSTCLKINYNILIGKWIHKYLAECPPNDTIRLLEMLQTVIARVQKLPLEQTEFQSSLWQYLGPYLKLKVTEDSSLQLADVSFSLCLLSQSYCDTLREIMLLFLSNNSTNIGLVQRFLWQLVQQKDLLAILNNTSQDSFDSRDVLIIKGWIRCSLLSLDCKNNELCRITNYITYLPFMADICMDLPSSTDPLTHFIVAVSNKFKVAKDIFEKTTLRQRMSCYFMGMEKWVEPYIKQPKSQEIIGRIYHVVGLIFSLMPSFIYVKSRPNTVLKGVLDIMFLPMSAYKQDFQPSPQMKSAITADIHLYLKGLCDLAVMRDAFINRCIEDLVKIYLPCVVGGSRCALHECIERADVSARLVLTTVCSVFIKRKAPSPHPHCPQALRFLVTVAKAYSRESRVMQLLVDCCFEHICDVIMFCDDFYPSKTIARDVLVLLFESYSFGNEMSEKMMEKFENLCRDYLPFLPGKPFALFHEVLRHRPELVSRFQPTLLNHIKIVETKRGIDYDQSLRMYLDKLNDALKCLRNGA